MTSTKQQAPSSHISPSAAGSSSGGSKPREHSATAAASRHQQMKATGSQGGSQGGTRERPAATSSTGSARGAHNAWRNPRPLRLRLCAGIELAVELPALNSQAEQTHRNLPPRGGGSNDPPPTPANHQRTQASPHRKPLTLPAAGSAVTASLPAVFDPGRSRC